MHQRDSTGAPVLAHLTPAMPKPLIKGAPAALKPFLIAKSQEIQRNLNLSELIDLTQAIKGGEGKDESSRREVPVWDMIMQEPMNHMQKRGWDEIPSETKNTGCAVRQIWQSHQNSPQELKSSDRQLRGQEWRKELW